MSALKEIWAAARPDMPETAKWALRLIGLGLSLVMIAGLIYQQREIEELKRAQTPIERVSFTPAPAPGADAAQDLRKQASQHYLNGMIAFQKRDLELAGQECRKAKDLNPGDIDAAACVELIEKEGGRRP